jgi:transmembrane sensor
LASTDPTNGINDQAAEWAVEMAHGETTPESRAELEAWLAADRRHRGAYVRARAWLRATEDAVVEAHSPPASAMPTSLALVLGNDNEQVAAPRAPGSLRSAFFWWSGRAAISGAALAASVAALMVLGVPLLAPFRQTELAAAEIVKLKDGSVATLNEDARIEVTLTGDLRKVTLLSGEATFNVAKDTSRPFVVQSGEVYAQATGTVYSVSRAGLNGGIVKVTEGSVLVWPHDERDQAVLLRAGGALTLDPGPSSPVSEPTASTSRPLPPPELAQISLDNVTIRSAVVRFNRVNSTKITVADPAIGDVRIIGLYRANDPEQFARAAAAITGGYIEREKGEIVIKMK